MLNSFQALNSGRLNLCEDKYAFPIMRWMSGDPINSEICRQANIAFFKIKPKMVYSLLSLCPKKGFVKYPKKTKVVENEGYEILKPYIKQMYGWSDRELEINNSIITIMLNKPEYIEELNNKIGFTKDECKKLGIKFKVEKYEYKPKSANKTLFDFKM